MTPQEYCLLIKNCVRVIEKHLIEFKREPSEFFYTRGPTLGYSLVKNFKKKKEHNDFLTFDLFFSTIHSELGKLELCSNTSHSPEDYESYQNARQKIFDELGLIEIYKYSVSGYKYVDGYRLPHEPYHNIHTDEEIREIQEMWKKIN